MPPPLPLPPQALGQTYNRVVLMPPLDYASRLLLLSRAVAVPGVTRHPSLDLSSLTKLTDGFTAGHCLDMVHQVGTLHRRTLPRHGAPGGCGGWCTGWHVTRDSNSTRRTDSVTMCDRAAPVSVAGMISTFHLLRTLMHALLI